MVYMKYSSQHRQLHSTETALLRVQNDILQAADSRGGATLVLLDFSAAFDTIDHEKLIGTLDAYCGKKEDPLKWFSSYLKGRVQSVQIGSTFSREQNLLFDGVPQSSVLGPLLFTIYTTPLGRIIQRHVLTYHLYADDTQLYMAFIFLEVKCRQNWTSDHYNPLRAPQNIRYIDRGRWSVDLSEWWSTKKLRNDILF